MADELPPKEPAPLNYQSPLPPGQRKGPSATKIVLITLLTIIGGFVLLVAIVFGACVLAFRK